jgi:hypothetical protein
VASTTKNSSQQISVKSPAELTAVIERLTEASVLTSGALCFCFLFAVGLSPSVTLRISAPGRDSFGPGVRLAI